jgi:hypothetical protein
MLKPDIKQMLEVGMDCGLSMLEEAYTNYMTHYDLFFSLGDYQAQYLVFAGNLRNLGLIDEDDYLKEVSIEDCLKIIQEAENNDKA